VVALPLVCTRLRVLLAFAGASVRGLSCLLLCYGMKVAVAAGMPSQGVCVVCLPLFSGRGPKQARCPATIQQQAGVLL
jgi:hypothetical protein